MDMDRARRQPMGHVETALAADPQVVNKGRCFIRSRGAYRNAVDR
jgi:hypothetical protein